MVSASGSDANPGTQAQPFSSIAHADAVAAAGDTINVAPGTYTISAPTDAAAGIATSRSGTPSAHIKFVSQVKWGPKIVVTGSGTGWSSKGNYVDITGFDVTGTGRIGIFASGAYSSIANNSVHDLTIGGGCNGKVGAAIQIDGSVGHADVSGNVVRNIGASMLGSCNSVQGIYIANPGTIVATT